MASSRHVLFIVITEFIFVLPSAALEELRLLAQQPWNSNRNYEYGPLKEKNFRHCDKAIQKALKDINAFKGLLDGYNLTYHYVDTLYCSKTEGMGYLNRMKNIIRNEGNELVIIGGECPVVTQMIPGVLLDRIVQIEYLSTSSNLADRNRFPKLYRLTAPERVGTAIVQLLRTFNWNRVGIIAEERRILLVVDFKYNIRRKGRVYIATKNNLRKEVENTNIAVIANIFVGPNSTILLENMKSLKNLDARIIIVSASRNATINILCNAYKLAIYGKQFVWIFTEKYPEMFWKDAGVDCTEDELQQVVEGGFFIHALKRNPFEKVGKANITYSGLIKDIHTRGNVPTSNKFDYALDKCYDHVWVAAFALDCHKKQLEKFDFEVLLTTVLGFARFVKKPSITKCIEAVDFEGTSGRILFDDGAVNQVFELQRIQDAKTNVVAYFMPHNRSNSHYEWTNGALMWQEKSVPESLSVTMFGLAGVGLIVTIACFSLNVIWRNHRIVKMSLPNINSVLLVGCLLMYVTIAIKTTVTTNKAMCAVRLFCFWIGFATTFGSMLSKTWRVYRIFTNKRMKLKMSIRDKHLLVIIGILVSMETLFLIVWEGFSPHRIDKQMLKTDNVTTDSGDKIAAFYLVCVSDYSSYFSWTLHIVNGALIAFGAFLAWETRRVHIDDLNDSKTIGICLYNVVVLTVVGLVLSLILKDKPIELLGVSSVCLFVGTLVSEVLIFLPKMLAVYRKSTPTTNTVLKGLELST